MDDDATIRSEATSRTSSMHSYSRPNRAPNPVSTPNRNRNHNVVSSIPSAALSLAAEFKPSELLNRTVVNIALTNVTLSAFYIYRMYL